MSHGEGQRESRVLTDAAAAMWLTHPGDMRQAQSLAGRVDGCTDVLPGKKKKKLCKLSFKFLVELAM